MKDRNYDGSLRHYVESELRTLDVGQSIVIERHIFQEAYRCGWPGMYETPEQAFLSGRVGSAWGTWRVRVLPESGDRIVSRHEAGEKRVYCDPDREWMFKRMPDGTLETR